MLGAFTGCKNLSTITVDKDNEIYTDGNSNCVIEKSSSKLIFGGKNTIIPDYVTCIEDYAFYGSDISTVVIPSKTKQINYFSFLDCNNLSSVKIENGVESIYWGAFHNCINLLSIEIPQSVTTIENLDFGYYYDEKTSADAKIEGFTIYGVKGSSTEDYANENKFAFVEKTLFVRGDANKDGKVTISDATCIQQYLAHSIDSTKIDLIAAAMMEDKLSILDVTHIQQYLAHMIKEL